MDIYCVYLTTYSGNKLPPFYIGSTTIQKVNDGYKGSVKSNRYKQTWKEELKTNKNLFKTKIVSIHKTRKEAIIKENKLQKLLNVVSSTLYINMSLANINGFFGMDVSGKNNPNYGKKPENFDRSNYKKPKSETHKNNLKKPKTQDHKNKLSICKTGTKASESTKAKMSISHSKKYIGLSPKNNIFIIVNMTKFCQEHTLTPQNACDVANNKRKHHKHWKFFHFDEITLKELEKSVQS